MILFVKNLNEKCLQVRGSVMPSSASSKDFGWGIPQASLARTYLRMLAKKKNNKNGGFCVPYLPTLRFFHLSTH